MLKNSLDSASSQLCNLKYINHTKKKKLEILGNALKNLKSKQEEKKKSNEIIYHDKSNNNSNPGTTITPLMENNFKRHKKTNFENVDYLT